MRKNSAENSDSTVFRFNLKQDVPVSVATADRLQQISKQTTFASQSDNALQQRLQNLEQTSST